MSILVDGDLQIESLQTRQSLEHLGNEQLEREQHSVVAKVEREAPDELAPRCGGICEREQELCGPGSGEVADVAVQEQFCDGIERFVNEEQWRELVWPGEKVSMSSRGRFISVARLLMATTGHCRRCVYSWKAAMIRFGDTETAKVEDVHFRLTSRAHM